MKLLDAMLQVGAPIENVAGWCRQMGVNERTYSASGAGGR